VEIYRFNVYVAAEGIDLEKALDTGEYQTHRVTILHPDQLVAEQAGPRYGLGTDIRARPIDYSTLWCWVALQRIGVEVTEYPLWKQRVLSIDKIKGDGDALDPTTPDPVTGSP
jgi:hypothetical protein